MQGTEPPAVSAPSPGVTACHTLVGWQQRALLGLISGVSYATSEGCICLVPVFIAECKSAVQTVLIPAEIQRKDTKFVLGVGGGELPAPEEQDGVV